MGLKSGSRDAGLDDEDDGNAVEDETADGTARDEGTAETEHVAETADTRSGTARDAGSSDRGGSTAASADASASDERTAGESGAGRSGSGSIPYKLRRDKVNDGREQVPYFLREEVIDAEDELQDALEAMLGEDVYKSDYREASMVVAQRNPELVAEVLREWGYDYDFD